MKTQETRTCHNWKERRSRT